MIQDLLQTQGRIFDIQRYSIHDGPGIRSIVFLKGCFMHCRWCCNPESQEYKIQTMVQNGKTKTVGRDVTVQEVMDVVLQDRPYYRRSGGGMTLSGGECLFQADFASALLQVVKASLLNTAIETTALAPYEKIEKLLPYVDTLMLDIKHMDSAQHKAYTGAPNDLILENARKIAAYGKCRLIIRVPVIPTFNDSPEQISQIAAFASSLRGVSELHLLPYHRLGLDKYKGLGRSYSLMDLQPPTDAHMNELLDAAEQSGLNCQIGG